MSDKARDLFTAFNGGNEEYIYHGSRMLDVGGIRFIRSEEVFRISDFPMVRNWWKDDAHLTIQLRGDGIDYVAIVGYGV